ncbi:hypothetical protein Srot_2399 [Segniliparus rotundus DSM 44985]|uniref:Uncharacterized protein n=1 Tax=Segniliparus rotundus (strain ATCC BAA-972 / CDC 1076 / CIP 108378 / DSM 44985 / JCM 13578) TaxID=640132 RepID=D6ZAV7_SEGRD|nr:hypothetical protein [Segniliparus rotundus]ADG98843.1 hypothetical protein Srot_2399 [Segniliparus rotundus DSM 44985]
MSAGYPRPTGEIEAQVVDGLWVELSELLVQAWADRFADVRDCQLGCSQALDGKARLLAEVFTGDGGHAARDALERRAKDYEDNSDASEQDRAHAQKLADDIRTTKVKMAQVASTVKSRVDAIRFRAKLQNKPGNLVDAEIADQIAQGRKACQELADQLRDSAKTIASNSGGDSEDDSDAASRRGGGVATASEQHEAKSRVMGEAPKAAEDAPVHRDGAPDRSEADLHRGAGWWDANAREPPLA